MNRQRSTIAYTRRVHRKSMKAARARNRGRFDTLSGEQIQCYHKRAFKRQIGALDVATHLPPSARDGEAFGKPISVQKFLPSWLELRPKSVEPERIQSEEAA